MPQPVSPVVPPVLLCIAQHESNFQQFTPAGYPLISPTSDVGIMQINLPTWGKKAKEMGLNIRENPSDNIAFGIWLYNTKGPSQWTTFHKYCAGNTS